jgi:PIN domain nuclease of toxin-antitoxin system
MKLLLDTHIFLWFISGDDYLQTGGRVFVMPTMRCT